MFQNLANQLDRLWRKYPHGRTFIRYCLVGLLNNVVSLSIIFILAWFGAHYVVYTGLAFIAGLINAYLFNAKWTFGAKSFSWRSFFFYFFVNGLLVVFTTGFEYLLIDLIGIRELFGVITGLVMFTGVGFVLNRRIVFADANSWGGGNAPQENSKEGEVGIVVGSKEP